MRNIGLEMKNRRLELGKTLQDVADHVGTNKGTVSKWENGSIDNIKIDKIEKLSEALRVSPLFFISDKYDINSDNLHCLNDTEVHYAKEISNSSLLKSIVDILSTYSEEDAMLVYQTLKRINNINGADKK